MIQDTSTTATALMPIITAVYKERQTSLYQALNYLQNFTPF